MWTLQMPTDVAVVNVPSSEFLIRISKAVPKKKPSLSTVVVVGGRSQFIPLVMHGITVTVIPPYLLIPHA